MNTLGTRLKELTQELDITPAKLSRDLERNVNYIASIIKGENKNPGKFLFEYLQVRYNVDTQWLKHGEGSMFREGGKKKTDYAGARLILAYNALSYEDQKMIEVMIEALTYRAAAKKSETDGNN